MSTQSEADPIGFSASGGSAELPPRYRRSRPAPFVARLAILGGAAAGAGYVAAVQPWLPSLLAQAALGLLWAHALELQHQCLHGTAFSSARANRWVGFALGVPMGVSFTHYRVDHLHHHRWVGTPRDSEFFSYDRAGLTSWLRLLRRAYTPRRLRVAIRNIARALRGGGCCERASARDERRIRREYRAIAALLAVSVLASLALGSPLALQLWVAPLLLTGEAAHFLIELPEHYGIPQEAPDPRTNSRTIDGSWFSRWFTHSNNFHAEHHLHPAVPFHELRELSRRLGGEIAYRVPSYTAFYRALLSQEREALLKAESVRGFTEAGGGRR